MFTQCPYCKEKALPIWKKPFVNNEYVRQFSCQKCGKWLVLSYKWIWVFVLLSLLIVPVAILLTKHPFLTTFIYCGITIPVFILLIPLKPYK